MNSLRKKDIITLILAIVLFGVLQFLMAERIIGSFWELNIFLVCVNIIMAASLNLINGYTGQFSLGHAGFMAVGAYVGVILTVNFHSPFIVALLIGGFAAGILGFLIGLPTLRLKGDYLAIATLGLGEIIRIVIMNIEYVGGAAGFKGIPHNTTFPWVFFIMLFTLFFIKNFVNSKYGRSCIAVRENEIAAEAMGVNTTKYKVMAFTIGAIFAGIGGGLFAHCFYIINPSSFTFMASFNFLIMVVLGGLGSITGSIAGAFVVTFVSAALASWPEFRMIAYALVLILLMFYRPQGLFGYTEITSLKIFQRFRRSWIIMELLKTDGVSKVFGGLKAVSNFDIEINEGELIGLIGPNGAGKTTAFNLLTGVYQPTTGTIDFAGKSLVGLKPYQITSRGIARTFQNIRLFSELTVLDNVKIAYDSHAKYSLVESVLRLGRYFKEEDEITKKSLELLKIFKLEDKAYEVAKNLPYGAQRRLEIARALATKPKLLLLDEPAAGMNPQETQELMEMIRWIRKEFGLSILLIEHDMSLVMGICERIYVLEYGCIIASGTPEEIQKNPEVIKAYLGGEV